MPNLWASQCCYHEQPCLWCTGQTSIRSGELRASLQSRIDLHGCSGLHSSSACQRWNSPSQAFLIFPAVYCSCTGIKQFHFVHSPTEHLQLHSSICWLVTCPDSALNRPPPEERRSGRGQLTVSSVSERKPPTALPAGSHHFIFRWSDEVSARMALWLAGGTEKRERAKSHNFTPVIGI